MIVRASRNDAETVLGDTGGKRFCVQHHLSLILAELRLERFVETNRFGRDHVHQRSSLHPRKNGGVDRFGKLLLAKNDPAARPAHALVRRRGDEVCMRHRGRMFARGDESRDVRHVDEEKRVDRVSDLPKPGKIQEPRIGRSPGGNHRRTDFLGLLCQRVVIDLFGLLTYAGTASLDKVCRKNLPDDHGLDGHHARDSLSGCDRQV